MPDILHRAGIGVRPDRVCSVLTTIEGLQHWWVVATSGDAGAGGTIDFVFCKMKVVKTVPDE